MAKVEREIVVAMVLHLCWGGKKVKLTMAGEGDAMVVKSDNELWPSPY